MSLVDGVAATSGEQLLELSDIVKQFTGTLALDHVDLQVRRGEIHALLGQNGAGKSTLIKIMAGIYPPTAGRMRWRGQDVAPGSSSLPITFIHQDLGLVEAMTVAENVAILTGYPKRRGLIDWAAAAKAARVALGRMGSDIDPEARVATLSAADKSIVAIARALAQRCDLLVLDEPTAALPAADVDLLLGTLQRLKASGIGLLYVTHRLDEVFRDRRPPDGSARRPTHCHPREPRRRRRTSLSRGSSGARSRRRASRTSPSSDAVLLSLNDVVVAQDDGAGHVGPVSFAVRRGETLGLVGLRGGRPPCARSRLVRRPADGERRRHVQGRVASHRQPGGGDPERHRLRVQPQGRGEPRGRSERAREPVHQLAHPRRLAVAAGRARTGTRGVPDGARAFFGPPPRPGPRHRHP